MSGYKEFAERLGGATERERLKRANEEAMTLKEAGDVVVSPASSAVVSSETPSGEELARNAGTVDSGVPVGGERREVVDDEGEDVSFADKEVEKQHRLAIEQRKLAREQERVQKIYERSQGLSRLCDEVNDGYMTRNDSVDRAVVRGFLEVNGLNPDGVGNEEVLEKVFGTKKTSRVAEKVLGIYKNKNRKDVLLLNKWQEAKDEYSKGDKDAFIELCNKLEYGDNEEEYRDDWTVEWDGERMERKARNIANLSYLMYLGDKEVATAGWKIANLLQEGVDIEDIGVMGFVVGLPPRKREMAFEMASLLRTEDTHWYSSFYGLIEPYTKGGKGVFSAITGIDSAEEVIGQLEDKYSETGGLVARLQKGGGGLTNDEWHDLAKVLDVEGELFQDWDRYGDGTIRYPFKAGGKEAVLRELGKYDIPEARKTFLRNWAGYYSVETGAGSTIDKGSVLYNVSFGIGQVSTVIPPLVVSVLSGGKNTKAVKATAVAMAALVCGAEYYDEYNDLVYGKGIPANDAHKMAFTYGIGAGVIEYGGLGSALKYTGVNRAMGKAIRFGSERLGATRIAHNAQVYTRALGNAPIVNVANRLSSNQAMRVISREVGAAGALIGEETIENTAQEALRQAVHNTYDYFQEEGVAYFDNEDSWVAITDSAAGMFTVEGMAQLLPAYLLGLAGRTSGKSKKKFSPVGGGDGGGGTQIDGVPPSGGGVRVPLSLFTATNVAENAKAYEEAMQARRDAGVPDEVAGAFSTELTPTEKKNLQTHYHLTDEQMGLLENEDLAKQRTQQIQDDVIEIQDDLNRKAEEDKDAQPTEKDCENALDELEGNDKPEQESKGGTVIPYESPRADSETRSEEQATAEKAETKQEGDEATTSVGAVVVGKDLYVVVQSNGSTRRVVVKNATGKTKEEVFSAVKNKVRAIYTPEVESAIADAIGAETKEGNGEATQEATRGETPEQENKSAGETQEAERPTETQEEGTGETEQQEAPHSEEQVATQGKTENFGVPTIELVKDVPDTVRWDRGITFATKGNKKTAGVRARVVYDGDSMYIGLRQGKARERVFVVKNAVNLAPKEVLATVASAFNGNAPTAVKGAVGLATQQQERQQAAATTTTTTTNTQTEQDTRFDSAKEARERGYRIVEGTRYDRQEKVGGEYGREAGVNFGGVQGGRVVARYKLVEADDLQASHLDTGQANSKFFLGDAQPKDRRGDSSRAQFRVIATDIHPEEITGEGSAFSGSPIVNERGEVIQGNGRTASLKLMYGDNYAASVAKYKEYLKANAEHFGLTVEQVEKMKNPILVREVAVDDATAVRLGNMKAQDTEAGGKQRIDEQQVSALLTTEELQTYTAYLFRGTTENQTLNSAVRQNAFALLTYLKDLGKISADQFNTAFDAKGNATVDAVRSLQGVLVERFLAGAPQGCRDVFEGEDFPNKAKKAIIETFWRDYNSPEGQSIMQDLYGAIMILGEIYRTKNNAVLFRNNDFEALRSAKNIDEVKRVLISVGFNQDDFLGSNADVYSAAAFYWAAQFEAETQTKITSNLNGVFTRIQDGIHDDLNLGLDKEADTRVGVYNDMLGIPMQEGDKNARETYAREGRLFRYDVPLENTDLTPQKKSLRSKLLKNMARAMGCVVKTFKGNAVDVLANATQKGARLSAMAATGSLPEGATIQSVAADISKQEAVNVPTRLPQTISDAFSKWIANKTNATRTELTNAIIGSLSKEERTITLANGTRFVISKSALKEALAHAPSNETRARNFVAMLSNLREVQGRGVEFYNEVKGGEQYTNLAVKTNEGYCVLTLSGTKGVWGLKSINVFGKEESDENHGKGSSLTSSQSEKSPLSIRDTLLWLLKNQDKSTVDFNNFLVENSIAKNSAYNSNLRYSVRAYQGGRGVFDRLNEDFIGTGEGAQVYGYGHYFSQSKEIGRWYAKKSPSEGMLDDDADEYTKAVYAQRTYLAKIQQEHFSDIVLDADIYNNFDVWELFSEDTREEIVSEIAEDVRNLDPAFDKWRDNELVEKVVRRHIGEAEKEAIEDAGATVDEVVDFIATEFTKEYLTDEAEVGQVADQRNVAEWELNVENPFDYDKGRLTKAEEKRFRKRFEEEFGQKGVDLLAGFTGSKGLDVSALITHTSKNIDEAKVVSEILEELGYDSIRYKGENKGEGEYNYVVFNPDNASLRDREFLVQYSRELHNPDGTVFGWYNPDTREVCLNEDVVDFDTPIHEFTHAWSDIVEQEDKRLADHIVGLVGQTKEYAKFREEVANDPRSPYRNLSERQMAWEVFSRLTGKRGEEIAMQEGLSMFARLRDAIKKFFGKLLNTFGLTDAQIEGLTLDECVGMTLRDLMDTKTMGEKVAFARMNATNARAVSQSKLVNDEIDRVAAENEITDSEWKKKVRSASIAVAAALVKRGKVGTQEADYALVQKILPYESSDVLFAVMKVSQAYAHVVLAAQLEYKDNASLIKAVSKAREALFSQKLQDGILKNAQISPDMLADAQVWLAKFNTLRKNGRNSKLKGLKVDELEALLGKSILSHFTQKDVNSDLTSDIVSAVSANAPSWAQPSDILNSVRNTLYTAFRRAARTLVYSAARERAMSLVNNIYEADTMEKVEKAAREAETYIGIRGIEMRSDKLMDAIGKVLKNALKKRGDRMSPTHKRKLGADFFTTIATANSVFKRLKQAASGDVVVAEGILQGIADEIQVLRDSLLNVNLDGAKRDEIVAKLAAYNWFKGFDVNNLSWLQETFVNIAREVENALQEKKEERRQYIQKVEADALKLNDAVSQIPEKQFDLNVKGKSLKNALLFYQNFEQMLEYITRFAKGENKRWARRWVKQLNKDESAARNEQAKAVRSHMDAFDKALETLGIPKKNQVEFAKKIGKPREDLALFSRTGSALTVDQVLNLWLSLRQDSVSGRLLRMSKSDRQRLFNMKGDAGVNARTLWEQIEKLPQMEAFLRDGNANGTGIDLTKVGDALCKIFADNAKRFNAACKDYFGLDGMVSEDAEYFPVVRDRQKGIVISSNMIGASIIPSAAIARVPNNNPISEVSGAFHSFLKTVEEVEHFIAYKDLSRYFSALFGNGTMSRTLNDKLGAVRKTALVRNVSDIINGQFSQEDATGFSGWFNKIVNFVGFTMIGFNPNAVLMQGAGAMNWLYRHTFTEVGKAALVWASPAESRKSLSEIRNHVLHEERYSPAHKAAMALFTKEPSTKLNKISSAAMAMLRCGDLVAACVCGLGFYTNYRERLLTEVNPKTGKVYTYDEAVDAACAWWFDEVEKLQQASNTANLYAAQRRGGGLARALFQFKSAIVQMWGNEIQAALVWWADKNAKNAARLGKAMLVNHVYAAGFAWFIENVLQTIFGDDDDDEDLWSIKELFAYSLIGQIAAVPILGDAIASCVLGEYMRSTQLPVASWVDRVFRNGSRLVENVNKAVDGEDEFDIEDNLKLVVKTAGGSAGNFAVKVVNAVEDEE